MCTHGRIYFPRFRNDQVQRLKTQFSSPTLHLLMYESSTHFRASSIISTYTILLLVLLMFFNMLLHKLYLMTILFLWYSIVLRYPIINWILSHCNGNTVFYPIPLWYSHDIPQNSAEPMAEHGTAVFQEEANPGPGANVLWKSPRDTIGHPHSWEKSWFYHQNPSKSYTLC